MADQYIRYPATGGGGGAPSGPAGGDLSGTYPNPVVAGFGGYADFPVMDGTAGQVLSTNADGTTSWINAGGGGGSAWLLAGNAGTNPMTDFLGTTDLQPMNIRTNNLQRGYFGDAGGLFIGTDDPVIASIAPLGTQSGIISNIPNPIGSGMLLANTDTASGADAILSIISGDLTMLPNVGVAQLNQRSFAFPESSRTELTSVFGDLFLDTSGDQNKRVVTRRTRKQTDAISLDVVNWGARDVHYKTISANESFTFLNTIEGQEIKIYIIGDATNPFTVDIPNTVKGYAASGFPISVPANQVLLLSLIQINGDIILETVAGPFA